MPDKGIGPSVFEKTWSMLSNILYLLKLLQLEDFIVEWDEWYKY